jgi:protein involved in polysaccharide export with SLBB domain
VGLGKGQIALLLAAARLLPSLNACSFEPALPWCGPRQREPAPAGGYQLGPGDRLRVAVYRHERLSGESTLDATGTLVMPLLGPIPADGLTPRELELEIEEQLQDDGYLRAPRVGIEAMTHRPFYILGEVSRPGEYEHVSGMTLLNAVALAGGYTYGADRTGATISRGHCVREATAATKVLPGEVIRVPARFF